MTTRYKIVQLTKGAIIHICQDCGTVVHQRADHDAHHALIAALITPPEDATTSTPLPRY